MRPTRTESRTEVAIIVAVRTRPLTALLNIVVIAERSARFKCRLVFQDGTLPDKTGSRHRTLPAHACVCDHQTTVSPLFFIAYPQTRVRSYPRSPSPRTLNQYPEIPKFLDPGMSSLTIPSSTSRRPRRDMPLWSCLFRGNVIVYRAQKAIQVEECSPRRRSWTRFPLTHRW